MAPDSSHTMSKLCEESGRGEQHAINLDNYEGLTVKSEEKELQICTSEESSSCSLQECSMCGDVGLAHHLFKCLICSYRYQHTYCSRIYPHKMGAEAYICNWCLPSVKLSETCDMSNYKQEPELLKPRPLQALENDQILQVKKHTKAFEYLLQIAECYNISPGVNNNTEENNDIVGHEERPAMLAQQNQRWDRYIGSPSEKKSFAWRGNMGKRQRNCNHNGDDIVAEERMHNINNKGSSALNRWTRQTAKRELHLSPPRAINRRYKLLADVLC